MVRYDIVFQVALSQDPFSVFLARTKSCNSRMNKKVLLPHGPKSSQGCQRSETTTVIFKSVQFYTAVNLYQSGQYLGNQVLIPFH